MTRVAVVTSCYGDYDVLRAPVEQDVDAEYVFVTDHAAKCEPWRDVVEPRSGMHPRLAAKVAKCRPDLYADADIYIWVDASINIGSPSFVSWAATQVDGDPIAQIAHPDRTSIVAEADASTPMPKYHGLPVEQQAAHYVASGFPDGYGIWAGAFIVRRAGLENFGNAWLAEQMRWTYQDQISEPFVLWRHGLRPSTIAEPLYASSRFHIDAHVGGKQ